jgi:hypothetical protein
MARADINSEDSRKAWRARNPDKDMAHRQVEFFVRRLRRAGLSKPNCVCCNISEEAAKAAKKTIQAHHKDYSKPLDVIWLCDSCHLIGHWTNSWKAERNGKAIRYLVSTTVVGEK